MELIDYKLPYCTGSEDSWRSCRVSDWRAAEHMAALWVRRFGYPDAQVTRNGNDEGIDVSATGAVAQVKWWGSKNANLEDTQRIVGVAKPGQLAMFFARKGYTDAALRWAEDPDARLALFQLRADGHITAVNRYAMQVLVTAPYRTPPYRIKPLPIRTRLLDGALAVLGTAATVAVFWSMLVSDWSNHPGWRAVVLLATLFCGGFHVANVCRSFGSSAGRLVDAFLARQWPGLRVILSDPPPTRPATTLPCDEFVGLCPSTAVRFGIGLELLMRRVRQIVRKVKARRPSTSVDAARALKIPPGPRPK